MEDILILLLQGLGQILLELLAYLPWDLFWDATPYSRTENRNDAVWWVAISSLIMGALLGYGSLIVFPDVLVKWGWLRIVLLFASPLCSGLISREMVRWRQRANRFIDPGLHFWIGLCFSIGFVWTRFAFAHRLG